MPTVASYCSIFLKPEMLHIYRQVTALQRYQTFILTKTRQEVATFPFDPVIELPAPRKRLLRRFVRKYLQKAPALLYRGEYDVLLDAVQTGGADLVHIYFGHTGVHLLPFIEKSGIPTLVSFHGADVMPRPDRPGYLDQLRRLLQVIPLALARSESLAARLRDLGCPPEKIRLNRTGIPLDQYSVTDRSQRPARPVRFVQACRLIEKKGLRTTIEAFAQVRRAFPESSLAIAGDGPLRGELQDLVARLGLAANLHFTGFLNQTALRELYAYSDIFVHPSEITAGSDQEGVPNSLLEAMATGLPVVATRHGGIPEAVTHGEEGFLVAEKDTASLAESMLALAADPNLRHRLGNSAAASVRKTFEQSAQIAVLESYYDEVSSR